MTDQSDHDTDDKPVGEALEELIREIAREEGEKARAELRRDIEAQRTER